MDHSFKLPLYGHLGNVNEDSRGFGPCSGSMGNEALTALKEHQFDDIQVYSDSLTLINLITQVTTHNDIQAILEDIRDRSLSFSSISFEFTPRLNVRLIV